MRAVVIEVSAQALTRHRVDGIVFDVVGFTNLTHDHLDDYGDMDDYFDGQARAVRARSRPARRRDRRQRVGPRLVGAQPHPASRPSRPTRSADADWRVTVLEETADGSTTFTPRRPRPRRSSDVACRSSAGTWPANAALAIVMLVESGFDLDAIAHALERDGGDRRVHPGAPSGFRRPRPVGLHRLRPQPRRVLDDPRGAPARHRRAAVIMVFGADGDRDTTKRDDMGAIAARVADVVVVTDFHPRFEDPASIRAALLAGAGRRPNGEIHEVPIPRTAFRSGARARGEGTPSSTPAPATRTTTRSPGEAPVRRATTRATALHEAGWL